MSEDACLADNRGCQYDKCYQECSRKGSSKNLYYVYGIREAPECVTSPTGEPTSDPTSDPTEAPTGSPTGSPTSDPTSDPTESPTSDPTSDPTKSEPEGRSE